MQDENVAPDQQPNTPTEQEAKATVPPQPVQKKPINTIRIAMYGLMGLAALGLVSNIARLNSHISAPLPKSAQRVKPATVNPEAVTSFQEQEREQVRKLEQENAEAQRAMEKSAEAAKAVGNTASLSMMPCTPALAGTQGASPTGSAITCGADGQWHPSAEATGIPAMSAAQRQALYGHQTGGNHDDPAQAAKQRRLEALNSTSVAIDFTGKEDQQEAQKIAPEQASSGPGASTPTASGKPVNGNVRPSDLGDHAEKPASSPAKYSWDTYTGKLYRIFEGTVLETVLTNRINGAFAGPINTMLTTDVWSHDHQQLLIPQGTRCLGTVSAVNGAAQQRLFVAFHRCIMPDGYSIDLDKFPGLNQIGEVGLRDLVNHHYFQIFGASLAIGAVGGLAQIGNGYSNFGYDPSVSIRNGISQQMGEESMQILDRFLNQLPTFIVRERSRVRIYLSGDLEVPAYAGHEIDPAL
jgi:type IV secretory pathway VirB10-like protein